MSNEVLEVLRNEQDRIVKMLPNLNPTTEEYRIALSNLGELQWRTAEDEHPATGFAPVEPRPVIVPADDPAPIEAATPAPVAESKPNMDEFRMALRERMADARISGVNITELIEKVGASKFSAVPDERLTELSDLLDAAVKESA